MCRNGLFIHSIVLYVALSIGKCGDRLNASSKRLKLGKSLFKAKAQNYTNYDEDYGKTWMYFPDGDGVPQVVYLMESPIGLTRSLSVKSRTNFELYTRYESTEKFVTSKIFDKSTRVLIEKQFADGS